MFEQKAGNEEFVVGFKSFVTNRTDSKVRQQNTTIVIKQVQQRCLLQQ